MYFKSSHGKDEEEVPDEGTEHRHHDYWQHPEEHGQQRDRKQQQQGHHVIAYDIYEEVADKGNKKYTAYSQEILPGRTVLEYLQELQIGIFIKYIVKIQDTPRSRTLKTHSCPSRYR